MNWKAAFSTNVGRKLLMGATGLFLITFLIIHCYINANIFFNDGGARFNTMAHFMGTNPVIRFIEIGLIVFLLMHTIIGLKLWFKNMGRRSTRYTMKTGKTSRWYSRSMGILGTLILLFLIIHLRNFWGPNRYSQTFGNGELDLFSMMAEDFSNIIVVLIYVAGCISLGWHLAHGFFSAFQTFGLATHRYKHAIRSVGIAFAIIVPLIFAAMPVWFYAAHMGWFQMTPSVFAQHTALNF
ncbi:MAG: succinate dehydrogenase cytochrome b subunit [Bacteroidetes bacterium]|nr:succinate dehydrogenase cytochrome b subunit [Bacteroidota bacterium]MBS1630314.1 succinate dehydrogenase cytochrome b subunit [Bacteroidota bacterium]